MSEQRKYSVAEIDRMRSALWERAYKPRSFGQREMDYLARTIEDQLRTYMLNGTDPDELTK